AVHVGRDEWLRRRRLGAGRGRRARPAAHGLRAHHGPGGRRGPLRRRAHRRVIDLRTLGPRRNRMPGRLREPPVAETVRDYYALLGVRRDATGEEIKRAYRKLARELHPDVNPDPAEQERFKEVTAAYEVLSDPEKRRIVDLGGDPLAPGGGQGTAGNPFAGFGGFSDVFEAFFGGGTPGGRGPRSRVRPGADALLRLELTLDEAAFGVRRDISVETAVVCQTCHGSGCAPGTSPRTCAVCGGVGEIQSVQRSFLGQVMTTRTCHACGGTGEQIPSPGPTRGAGGRGPGR